VIRGGKIPVTTKKEGEKEKEVLLGTEKRLNDHSGEDLKTDWKGGKGEGGGNWKM